MMIGKAESSYGLYIFLQLDKPSTDIANVCSVSIDTLHNRLDHISLQRLSSMKDTFTVYTFF